MTDTNAVDTYSVAEQIVRAQLQRDELDEMIGALKGLLRDEQGTRDLTQEGRPTIIVKVTSNSRIDDGLAREYLDADDYDNLSKKVIDTAKARAFLPAEDLTKITKTYDNKVEVKLA